MSDLKFKIGILSTIDNPLLPFFISAITLQGLKDLVVICDSKTISETDKRLWAERTNGAFDIINNEGMTIYAFPSLPFYFVDSHNSCSTIDLISSLDIKCLLNAGTLRKLSNNILQSAKHGVVNVHPGLLPEYRGCSAVEWAIYNDDKVGNTAHFMAEGYDTGPIIFSEWYEFPKQADYISMRVKIYRDGCVLAAKALRKIKETLMTPSNGIIQNENNARYWDPISEIKFKAVLDKVAKQAYRYQAL